MIEWLAEQEAVRTEYADLHLTDDQVERLASVRRTMGASNSLDRIYQKRLVTAREDARLLFFISLHDGAVEYQVLSGADKERADRLVNEGVLRFSGRYVVKDSVPVDDFGAPVTVAPDYD